MATVDRLLYSALHGTAMRYAAERRNLGDSIAELREIAGGRDDILAEVAGIEAGSWFSVVPVECAKVAFKMAQAYDATEHLVA
jgi:hypothetical protein